MLDQTFSSKYHPKRRWNTRHFKFTVPLVQHSVGLQTQEQPVQRDVVVCYAMLVGAMLADAYIDASSDK